MKKNMKERIAPALVTLAFAALPAAALADLSNPQGNSVPANNAPATQDYAAPDEVQTPGVGAAAPLTNSSQSLGGSNTGSGQSVGGSNTGAGQGVGGSNTGSSHVSTISNPLSSKFNSIGGIIEGFVEIFTYLVVIAGVLALVWVGFQFILAQGNADRLSELKNWLLYIVIGIAIVIGARIIINVVINTLEASGTVNPSVIQSAKKAANGQ